MTEFCYWVALVAFGIAFIVAVAVPANPPRWLVWPAMVALGLLLWLLPAVLTASGISHT